MIKKVGVLLLGLLIVLSLAGWGEAQSTSELNFPKKNITFVHPSTAGGGNHIFALGVIEAWEKYLPEGINVIVEPKPGGGNVLEQITFGWPSRTDIH